jgi:plastocyanin
MRDPRYKALKPGRMTCRMLITSVLTAAAVAGSAWAGLGARTLQASQKGQAFRPGDLSIKRGDTVEVANDDGDILHHAYVESATFSFDSGDQEPGAKVSITFPVSGTFNVLCGIHPRMKMRVQVD